MKDYPFIEFSILFITGIISDRLLQFNPDIYLIIILAFTLSLILINYLTKNQTKNVISTLMLFCIIFFTGSFVANVGKSKIDSPLTKYQKENKVKLFAEVDNIELEKSYEIVFTVRVDSLFIDNKKLIQRDKLICKFRGDSLQRHQLYEKLNPGNKIFLTGIYQKGRDQRNPGEFDYNKYLNSKGITGLFISYNTDSVNIVDQKRNVFKTFLFKTRKSIDKVIHDLHQPETAGLLRGLILADRSEIDFETKNDFINSGVIHILAVSGLHVGYLLLIFILIFGRFGIYSRSILTIIGLIIFMLITGVPPSVFRATLMAIIIILTILFNRSTNIINSVFIAAVIILVFNPSEIYNPGFQLSFAAVLSIAIIYPKIQKTIYGLHLSKKWLEYILLFLGVSLSAQIGTIPFTLAYFSKLSLIALFTNLIVIPAVGAIIGIGFITLLTGALSYSVAIYFAAANDLITKLLTDFIKYTGKLSFSFLWIRDYSLYDSIIFYAVLFLLFLILARIDRSYLKILSIIIAFIAIVFLSKLDDKKLLSDDKLNVLMIDVGQGDSFLIKFPNGKTALIDAGEANPFIDNGERIIIPLLDYLGVDKIDYGFISHLDLDHYGGFVSLLHQNKIGEIFRPKPDSSDKSIRLEKYLDKLKIKRSDYHLDSLRIGNTIIAIFNDASNKFFDNLSSNDKSGFMKVVYGKTSFLFVGDAEIPAEYYYLQKYKEELDSDVLKVGHHGSITGSTEAFLNAVSPKIALVSAGIKNKFKHPSEIVLQRLKKFNSKIYRTDLLGAVLLQSDGDTIKYIDWRNQ